MQLRSARNFWRKGAAGFTITLVLVSVPAFAQADMDAILHEHWSEARSAHFNIYSCGATQEVNDVVTRLEQFHDAYALLAGAQAVSSPPIIVMAFPDQKALEPFLPLYNGKPANLSGFFNRSADENLIVLALTGTNSGSMQTIFHEYTHLLFRHNDRIWPIWLQEGMAEIYSTFEVTGRGVRIGEPIQHHLRLLARSDLMPLKELLAVTHDSPQYNESEHQGVFYAESWLLTHFLMNGDNPALKARFGNFTKLLRQGVPQEEAFTRALGMPLPAVEAELRRYLERQQFDPMAYVLPTDLSANRPMATRPIGQAETCFRLGNELMRIERLDDAETKFKQARKLAPQSPLPYEGLGLLASVREKPDEAVRQLKESLQRGSTSFLANYVYAEELFHQTEDGHGNYPRMTNVVADELRARLKKSAVLMPSFSPTYKLLGLVELVQGDNPDLAEKYLRQAILLEPENQWHLLLLAQAQLMKQDAASARQTLETLRQPQVEAKLRARAEEAIKEIDQYERGRPVEKQQ